eukprot:4320263-Amphidinium_carterae.2
MSSDCAALVAAMLAKACQCVKFAFDFDEHHESAFTCAMVHCARQLAVQQGTGELEKALVEVAVAG